MVTKKKSSTASQDNNTKKLLLTEEGLKKLQDELENLKGPARKEISERLKKSLTYGDLKENFEYQEAKESQALNESRILEIEEMLKNVEIVDENKVNKTTVEIGNKVKIRNVTENDKPEEFTIVGTMEADPFNGKISNESPIGSSVIDKKVGDVFKVHTPAGDIEYELVSFS